METIHPENQIVLHPFRTALALPSKGLGDTVAEAELESESAKEWEKLDLESNNEWTW